MHRRKCSTGAQPWLHSVAGNHEAMATAVYAGQQSELSYSFESGAWFLDLPRQVRAAYAVAFASLPVAIALETESGLCGIVHAGCPVDDWRSLAATLEGEDGYSPVLDAAPLRRQPIVRMKKGPTQCRTP